MSPPHLFLFRLRFFFIWRIFFINPHVWKCSLKHTSHHRGCDRSSIVSSMWFINQHDPNDRRIVCFRNPKKEEIYFPFPLGSFSLVAVFPPMEKPSIRQFLPDPSETTASNNSFIVSDVCFL